MYGERSKTIKYDEKCFTIRLIISRIRRSKIKISFRSNEGNDNFFVFAMIRDVDLRRNRDASIEKLSISATTFGKNYTEFFPKFFAKSRKINTSEKQKLLSQIRFSHCTKARVR